MKPFVGPIGTGDLKVVKMKLLGYEPTDIADIQHVMGFEKRERTHRRLRRFEETFTEEFEREEEKLRELEKNERFQIEQQTQEVVRSETKFEAGAEISAGFGPVQIGAYARFSTSQSKEETDTYSTNYAKDVMERSLDRIIERVRSERITKTLEESEETNKHGFDNTEAENISGIYWWLNKSYRAKVVNYGKRLWYEFIIPQPASFFILAQRDHLENHVMPEEPETPKHPANSDEDLKPKDIDRTNYLDLVQQYGVDGIKPPPKETVRLVKTISRDTEPERNFAIVDNDLEIPDGYVVDDLLPRIIDILLSSDSYKITAFAGRKWVNTKTNGVWADGGSEPIGVSGRVPIAILGHGIAAFTAVTEVICKLTDEGFQAWQLDVYRAIMNAYLKEKQNFEEKVAAAQIEQSVKIAGKNPLINRQLIIDELIRGCITLWTGFNFDGVPMISQNEGANPPANFPRINIDNTLELIPEISFIHQAFDWFNLTFEFYPYFWARKKDWLDIYSLEDKDPLFTDFLRAGAARVLVPVHLEATQAVLYYQATGNLQLDGDIPMFEPPDINDTLITNTFDGEPETELELYNAYMEELRGQDLSDNIDKDIEILADDPDTWVIEEPTSLLWLQADGSELPPLEDI